MAGSGHPKKEIRAALDDADDAGLNVVATTAGHRWGYVACPTCGQRLSIWSTPRNAEDHAKDIRRFTAKHLHDEGEQ